MLELSSLEKDFFNTRIQFVKIKLRAKFYFYESKANFAAQKKQYFYCFLAYLMYYSNKVSYYVSFKKSD